MPTIAHWDSLLGSLASATADAVANLIARRGASAELKAAWVELTGQGAVATSGAARLGKLASICGVNQSDVTVALLRLLATDRLAIGGTGLTTEIRDDADALLMRFSNAAEEIGDVGMDPTGRLLVCTSDGEGQLLPTFNDLPPSFVVYQKPGDSLAADTVTRFPLTGPLPDNYNLTVHYTPSASITRDNTNYGQIDIESNASGVYTSRARLATTGSGTYGANVPIGLSAQNTGVAPVNTSLVLTVSKPGGSGRILPAGPIQIQFTRAF